MRLTILLLASVAALGAQSNGRTYPTAVFVNRQVAAPTVSPTPGSYSTAQSITLWSATVSDDLHIYYTTDGTTTPNCAGDGML